MSDGSPCSVLKLPIIVHVKLDFFPVLPFLLEALGKKLILREVLCEKWLPACVEEGLSQPRLFFLFCTVKTAPLMLIFFQLP